MARRLAAGTLSDLTARAVVIVLFSLLSANLLADFLRTGHVTGLLLLVSESLVVVMTIVRRPARLVDRSIGGVLTTALSLAGPPLLRAAEGPGGAPDAVTALVSMAGLGLVIAGKLALGRSFGIAAANRGIVMRGPYLIVRHPIYAGYITSHLAFLAAHPTPWNATVVAVADAALVMRALVEERVLGADTGYRTYCGRVGWRLLPRVF